MTMNRDFVDFELKPELLKAVCDMGFEKPTDVQAMVLPIALAGKDVIVQAQTGTGKTAAFGIPIMEKLSPKTKDIQALVLTPTRELAVQIAADLSKLGRYKGLRSVPIYGGQAVKAQEKVLNQRVHIITGTPGRILDHIRKGHIDLTYIRILVLDEADEMLNLGLIEEVKSVIAELPLTRQTMMFSATITKTVEEIAELCTLSPQYVCVTPQQLISRNIEQWCCVTDEDNKKNVLRALLSNKAVESAMVFCRTREKVTRVTKELNTVGFTALGLRGDLPQKQRSEILRRFKCGECKFLVATDVAARGLDIQRVTLVVNYDIPQYPEIYVHRIGRTGRANHTGMAAVFCTEEELGYLEKIEASIGQVLVRKDMHSLEQEVDNLLPHEVEAGDYTVSDMGRKEQKSSEITRLYIGAGRKNKLRAGDIVGAITGETGIDGEAIGVIEIYDTYSFVDILAGYGDAVLKKMQNGMIKGRRVKIEKAE